MESQRINYNFDIFGACSLAKSVVQYILERILYPKSAFNVNVLFLA